MKAELKDIDRLVQLRLAYLKEDFGGLDEKDILAIEKQLPDYLRSHLNKDLFVYISREDNTIAACAFLLVIEKPMSPSFINGKTGTVLNVYTCPASRHKGHAKRIMKELLEDAVQMDLCTVDLKATEDGYPLYKLVGFEDDTSKYHLMKWKNI